MNKFLAGSAVVIVSMGSVSASAETAPELDQFQELPVVLTASRLEQPLSEAPSAMTVIDRKMIEASGFRSIPDLFKLVPGMYVSYYKGNTPIVSYHGSNDQYARSMQVMIDGRSIYMPPMSTVEWSAIPYAVEDIERIEVIRGPSAASHGANSAQGVINIITRTPGRSQGTFASYRMGDKGVKDMYARLSRQGEVFDQRLSVSSRMDAGYDNLTTGPNGLPFAVASALRLLNNSYDTVMSRMLNYRADVHPDSVNNFDIQLGVNNTIKQVGWTDSMANQVHDLLTTAAFTQLGWTHEIKEGSTLSVRYSHSRQNQHESFTLKIDPRTIYQKMNVSRDDLEIQHAVSLPYQRLVYGAGYRADNMEGEFSALTPFFPTTRSYIRTHEWRVFAHDEMRLNDRMILNLGGMLESDWTRRERFSPRLSMNYHLTPEHTMRAGVSVAYRTPALMEVNFPPIQPGELFLPAQNPTSGNASPERVVSREIGYIGNFPSLDALVDVRAYFDRTTDGIFPDKKLFINGLSIDRWGAELTFKQKVSEASSLLVNLTHQQAASNGPQLFAAGYKFLGVTSPPGGAAFAATDIISAATPRLTGSLQLNHRFTDTLQGTLSYYHQGSMQPFDRGWADRQGSQNRTDLRLAKLFQYSAGENAKLELVVQNLFNQQYSEYVSNNIFNRRAYLTLSLQD